jgi:hypothetical protein
MAPASNLYVLVEVSLTNDDVGIGHGMQRQSIQYGALFFRDANRAPPSPPSTGAS